MVQSNPTKDWTVQSSLFNSLQKRPRSRPDRTVASLLRTHNQNDSPAPDTTVAGNLYCNGVCQTIYWYTVLSSHCKVTESRDMVEYIELMYVEKSVYVKMWEGPYYREHLTAMVKASPKGLRWEFRLS